ncbi:hypothetical protein QL285_090088 [Trifolium repens]|jgi:hypothetical protein|nr:hypothetical protein QL285_090088 [Trifolium repens]
MVRPVGFDAEPVISTKVVPRFDGTGDGYWWLIQLDRFLEANTWLCEERKVRWVTAFAFGGDAFNRWFNWKQGNQNITWEKIERAFIEKFVPDMWEMLEAAEGEEQKHQEYVVNETVENEEDSIHFITIIALFLYLLNSGLYQSPIENILHIHGFFKCKIDCVILQSHPCSNIEMRGKG